MQCLIREGVALAFEDSGIGRDALVLLHGWGCDHTTLLPQQSFFERRYRVLNVDLRGHGRSEAPTQAYSVSNYAEDVAWLCSELEITRAVIIGHSMGGAIAMELGCRAPALVKAVAMIDTVFQAPSELTDVLKTLLPALAGADYERAYRAIISAISLPSDCSALEPVLATLPKAPQHVLLSALKGHLEDFDLNAAALGCKFPVAYIGAAIPFANMTELKKVIAVLMTGQTLGSGHFAPLLVPEQLNAMLSRFLELVELKSRLSAVKCKSAHES